MDEKKQPVGLTNPDEESGQVRNLLDQCKPNPKPEQKFIRHEGKTFIIIKIEAFPFSHNPCFFKDHCYIRQGTTNLELAGEDLIDFLRKRTVLNFEESRCAATLKDVDFDKLKNHLNKRNISTENLTEQDVQTILTGLRVASTNGEFYLKNVAMLFFAKEPQKYFSNLEARIVKYRNKEASVEAIEFDKVVKGNLPELIKQSLETVSESIGKHYVLVGPERKEILDYPENALREVLTNAFGHRDYFALQEVLIELYPDRIRITNPGGLLPGQSMRNFERTPQHRNPLLYRLLRDFGFGEGLGLGIRMIRTEFRLAKLPDPEFFEIGNVFQVILYGSESSKKRHSPSFLSERQKQAIAYLGKNKILKSDVYAKITGISHVTAVNDLNELVKQGRLKKVGKFRGAHYELSVTLSGTS